MKICAFFLVVLPTFISALSCSAAGPVQNAISPHCKKPKLNGTLFVGCEPEPAFTEVKRLAGLNDANALFILGKVYELGGENFGLPDIKEDFNLAQKYYLESARLGNVDAEEAIAFIYLKWYRESRLSQGIYWQCRAASKGNVEAIINVKNDLAYLHINKSVNDYCHPIINDGEPTD